MRHGWAFDPYVFRDPGSLGYSKQYDPSNNHASGAPDDQSANKSKDWRHVALLRPRFGVRDQALQSKNQDDDNRVDQRRPAGHIDGL